jgi:hypothetical protein
MRTGARQSKEKRKKIKKYACAYAQTRIKGKVMKEGNVAINLSINKGVAEAVDTFIAGNKRKGRKNRSELTENLWISYLRKMGVKLPPLFKNGARA